MPSRMPNWKMRANALVDGMPMTRLCRMPSCGLACMMRTRRSTASAVIRLSASSITREVVLLAPAIAEVADVAGLEAGVDFTAPVGERDAAAPGIGELGEVPALDRGMREVAGVAQHIEVELLRDAARDKPIDHRRDVADDALRRLVADADQDGGRRHDRLVARDAPGRRRHRRHRIAREAHDDEADGRVPEADHRPRQRHREQHDQQQIAGAEAARRQRDRPVARSAPPSTARPA